MSIRIILASKLFKDSLFFINIFINTGKPSESHFLLSKWKHLIGSNMKLNREGHQSLLKIISYKTIALEFLISLFSVFPFPLGQVCSVISEGTCLSLGNSLIFMAICAKAI